MTLKEAKAIRAQIKLRRNDVDKSWEVWTTADGGNTFKWFKCTYETVIWYSNHLDIQCTKILYVDVSTGGLKEEDYRIYDGDNHI